MKKPQEQKGAEAGLVESFQRELYSGVEHGPGRQESERLRLLARLDSQKLHVYTAETAPQKTWLWIPVTASAATLLIALSIWLFVGRSQNASEEAFLPLAGLWQLKAGDRLSQGGPAVVPPGKGAKIVWPDGTIAWLSQNTIISISSENIDGLRLERGRILFQVTSRQVTRKFKVETKEGTVIVLGTVFSVERNDQLLSVRLHKGKVSLDKKTEIIPIFPGNACILNNVGQHSMRPLTDSDVLHDLMIVEKTLGDGGLDSPDIGKEIEMSPLGATVTPSLNEQQEPSIEASESGSLRLPKKKSEKIVPSRIAQHQLDDKKGTQFIDPELEAIQIESVTDESVIETITDLVNSHRYEEGAAAAENYLSAHPNGPNSEDALFLQGYSQTRSGHLGKGRKSFEEYLNKFPSGRYWRRIKDIMGE